MLETQDGIIAIKGRLDAFSGLKGFTKWFDLPRLQAVDAAERKRLDTLFDLFAVMAFEADALKVEELRAEHVERLTDLAQRLMERHGYPSPTPALDAVRGHVLWTLAIIESEGRPRWRLAPDLEPPRLRLPSNAGASALAPS